MLRERPTARTGKTWTANIPQDIHQAYRGSDASSRPSSRGVSATSSIRRRIDVSGRTVMDLTDERADRVVDNVTHSAFHEQSRELQPENVYHNPSTNLLHSLQALSATHTLDKDDMSGIDASKSVRTPRPTLSQVGRVDEDGVAAEPLLENSTLKH